MSVAKRLILLVCTSLIALAILGWVALDTAGRLDGRLNQINESVMPSVIHTDGAAAQLFESRSLVLTHILLTDTTRKAAVMASIQDSRKAFLDKVGNQRPLDDQDRALLQEASSQVNRYFALVDQALALSNDGKNEAAREMILSHGAQIKAMMQAVNDLLAYEASLTGKVAQASAADYHNSIILLLGVIGLAAAFSIAMGIMTYRRVEGPLVAVERLVEEVESELDFTRRVPVTGQDEISAMAAAFNRLLDRMQQSLSDITKHASEVSDAAAQMATAAQQVSVSSSQQSDAAASMAATVEEMTVSVTHVADRAGETNQLAVRSGQVATEGAEVIGHTVEDINGIAQVVRSAAEHIDLLDQDSAKVNTVVAVIREVADQTNLLALNAAIEAARAGEAGRGFAVVADEVRKLAERTASSTQEIASTIGSMQTSAKSAAEGMRAAVDQVESGVARTAQASDSIREISQVSQDTEARVGEISEAIREQSVASTSIAQQVERIAQMTEENSAAAAATADTARHLDELAGAMRQVVGQYRV